MKKILLLDNYDSFTYNLYHYLLEYDVEVDVKRNNHITSSEVSLYDAIVFSPGPGLPKEAGNMMEILKVASTSKPILGVCLGHQAIGEFFGGTLENLEKVYHGKKTEIKILDLQCPLYKNIPSKFFVGRYHSWVISHSNFPKELVVTATDSLNTIHSIRHITLPIFGVQYHPESIMTEYGKDIIKNFVACI